MRRLSIAAVAVAAALLPAAARLAAEESVRPATGPMLAAEKFLAAFRSSDAAGMRAIAEDPSLVPHGIADALLALHEVATPAEAPRTSDALDAAVLLADLAKGRADSAGLPVAVAAWRCLDREQLARDRRLRAVLAAVEAASEAGTPEAAEAPESSPDAPEPGAPDEPAPKPPEAGVPTGPHEAVVRLVRAAADDLDVVRGSFVAAALRTREGNALAALQRPDEAIAAHRAALAHAEAMRWPAGVAAAIRRIARVEASRRDFPAVVEAYERALELSERFGTRKQRAHDLTELVKYLVAAGRALDALPLAERALAEQEALGNHFGRGSLLLRLAGLRVQFGQRAEALALYDRAREHFAAAGDRRMVAHARYRAARILPWNAATHPRALAEFEEVAAVAHAAGDLELAAQAESLRGTLLGALGRHREEMESLHKAVEVSERSGNRYVQAVALGAFAQGVVREDLLEGLRARQRVVELLESIGERPARAYLQLAEVQHVLGRFPAAIESCRKALTIFRDLAHRHGEGYGTGYQARVRAVADTGALAALALWRGQPKERAEATAAAFDFGEASRAALLAEALAAPSEPHAESPDVAALRRRVHASRRRLFALAFGDGSETRGDGERGAPSPAGATPSGPDDAGALAEAKRDLDAAATALREALARDELDRRRHATPPAPPVSLEEARAALPEGTALVLHQQVVTRAWAVVLTRTGAHLVNLGDARAYDAATKAWERAIASPGGEEGTHPETLYEKILAPLEPFVPAGGTLLVSPDGPLAFLPFEAMVRNRDGERRRAVERWAIAYVPSATVYVAKRREAGTASRDALVALGDPVYPTERPGAPEADPRARSRGLASLDRLVATGDEVRRLGSLFPDDRRTVLVREEATRARLEAALAGVGERLRVLHLACHGYADASDPLQSGLVLSELDVLTVADVARARVPAELVVLSACESGRGTVRRGEGTLGFVRAFLRSGARHVLVATQRVGDERTRDVMRDFYDALLGDGLAPALALAKAKRARIAAGGPGAHPYAWSALVLWD